MAADEVATEVDLVTSERRLGYGIGQALEDLLKVGLFPTEIALDLLVLAALEHAADTRISRSTESQDSWTREIRLVVPVSEPAKWITVTPLLERMLNFLTGDRWTVGFRDRPSRFRTMVVARPRRSAGSSFDNTSLFSGGLDSLIGTIELLESNGSTLLVSHASEGATSSAQNACFDVLKAQYKRLRLERLRVWMSFPKDLVHRVRAEDSTRGRSFLFFALGTFAGSGLEHPCTLQAPENGLIALNVPLDPLRAGALSTRTTHPFFMARWNELLGALDVTVRIDNPYWHRTKGEMVSSCGNLELLKRLTPLSLSCSSPTKSRWKKRPIEHCGYCLPCLIRRAALRSAFGEGADPTTYTIANLKTRVLDTRHAEGQQIRSFEVAIERLHSRPDLAKLLIHKPGPLTDVADNLPSLAEVYRRGLEEVGTLLSGVRARPS